MKFYKVDSFSDNIFGGNPAAVCLISCEWPCEKLMQNIACENNLSETAFVLDNNEKLYIRWFTPTTEVSICGHATLAAAHVLFNHEGANRNELVFNSANHVLRVFKEEDMLALDFPQSDIWQIPFTENLDCFNFTPKECWRSKDEYLLVFDNQSQIENAVCNLTKATKIDLSGFIITAKSNLQNIDFVSRYFGPKIGINEDPVTGSAHTLLVPYWQSVLCKDEFRALQLSKRGGKLFCKAKGNRTIICGKAVTFAKGEILI